jgi:cardiolipin synthase
VTESASTRILTVPNVLSLLRLLTVPIFLWLFTHDQENIAVIIYAAGAWTDFFDGYIARRFNQVSEFGKLLDPLSDRVYIVSLAVALVVRGTLPGWLAGVVIGRDILVLIALPMLAKKGVARIPVNFTGKTATACLLFGFTCLAYSETTFGGAAVADDIGFPFVGIGAALYWAAGVMYAREAARRLSGKDTVRIAG